VQPQELAKQIRNPGYSGLQIGGVQGVQGAVSPVWGNPPHPHTSPQGEPLPLYTELVGSLMHRHLHRIGLALLFTIGVIVWDQQQGHSFPQQHDSDIPTLPQTTQP
jgi:hypothetical protein